MPKPINLKHLTENERSILVEAIPLLRNKDAFWFEDQQFKDIYQKWLSATNSAYHDESGFVGFKMAVKAMRDKVPLTFKSEEKPDQRSNKDGGLFIQKWINKSPLKKG